MKKVKPEKPDITGNLESTSLEQIIDKIEQIGVIYDIHFCRAGVGFKMYFGDGTEKDFREKLSIKRYYPNIRTAAIETYKILLKNGDEQ